MESANQRQIGGAHYGGGVYQHWDWCVDNQLGYLEGQITKYVARHREKTGREDLEKALHYADKLVEVVELGHYLLPKIPMSQRFQRRAALYVDTITRVYALTPEEIVIFKTLCEYTTLEELLSVQTLLRRLLKAEQEETHP